jgi:integrase
MAAHKTNDGRWRVWLDLGSDPGTGRRLRKKVEAKTKREAESKATALRERHARGENVLDKPRTVTELLDEWLKTIEIQGKAPNTLSAYHSAIKVRLRPQLGHISVPKLRTRAIQNVFNSLAEHLSPTYLRLLKTVLVQSLNFAIEQGDRTDNPAEKIRIPSVTHKPGRSLTLDEVRAVRAACEGHRYGLAIELALMGLRRSELPGLRWADFDEQAGTLYIRYQIQRDRATKQWTPVKPKDNSVRLLTLGPKLAAALRQYRWHMSQEREAMGWGDSDYIFTSPRNGGVCPPDTIYQAYRDIIKAAGVEARLHDCRHTAGTYLLTSGADLATVSGVLGHANPQVTASVYLHVLPHKVADASKRLEDIYE